MENNKKRALIIDDESVVRDFLKRFLTLLNLDVFEAESGQQAIELSRKNKFNVYFIDLHMPGLDGLDTFRQLHKINPKAINVITSGDAPSNNPKQTEEGIYCFIYKPFDINKIKEIVDHVNATT